MSPRLPHFSVESASPEQKDVLHAILSGPRGNLNGPFLSWIHSPELASRAQELGAFCRYGTGLSLRLSELAILCTAAKWKSQAEWYIHYPIGVDAGLKPEVLEDLRQDKPPKFDNGDEALIWRFVEDLYQKRRVSDEIYHEAVTSFGVKTVVNLVGLLGYYTLVAMSLNVFDVRADGQVELPFPDTP
ncbi:MULTISPECIES: carboxymuconolactone decarboxylase family protein [unclassified Herbaspirillum]|uniref:carboxymuconolactone decarboxylase family protein n=1 Tax=unclassified Herbaspirillum TaxID=2624150 RepID=UPI0011543E73|nr:MULTISPECIES: carboxymuconolactone decarboxylase family protein [unclassified Herbaspirillum]MBB5390086.1 4-carboxymuconolactone decarboxylase [Herbaspirillum sp. SJZ102]